MSDRAQKTNQRLPGRSDVVVGTELGNDAAPKITVIPDKKKLDTTPKTPISPPKPPPAENARRAG